MSIPVLSISQPVWERLRQGPLTAKVLAVFGEVCDLVTADGYVVALALPKIGNGPLSMLVAANSAVLSRFEAGMPATLSEARLQVGGSIFTLDTAHIWDPRPAWEQLRRQHPTNAARWADLRDIAARLARAGDLLALVAQGARHDTRYADAPSSGSVEDGVLAAIRTGTTHLRSGWSGDVVELRRATVQLAGVGSGLTPAGDDFLAGVMLSAWLAHAEPESLCSHIVQVAAPRTTLLSAAFLRAAARGECSEHWHMLLAMLAPEANGPMVNAVQRILSHGATSGADTLAGFLWAVDRGAL